MVVGRLADDLIFVGNIEIVRTNLGQNLKNPIELSEAELRSAFIDAEFATVLPTLAYSTQDMSLLKSHLQADPLLFRDERNGLSAEQVVEITEIAIEVLRRTKKLGFENQMPISKSKLLKIIEFCIGETLPLEYLGLLEEELAASSEDMRAPKWKFENVGEAKSFHVGIIGAGMSGLLCAKRLKDAGISFTVFEKNLDVGGTWYENIYPGCRVDIPNFLYSYSCFQSKEWPNFFSTQPTLLEYFRHFADTYELRDHIRFGVSVIEAKLLEESSTWSILLEKQGVGEVVYVDVVVSAVGQLNIPNIPSFEDEHLFQGKIFHSAVWPKDLDLNDKCVSVIGTGASAIQFVPKVSEIAKKVTVFQRTPSWFNFASNYHEEVPSGLKLLFQIIPHYSEWYRLWLFWHSSENMIEACRVPADWNGDEASVGKSNNAFRARLASHLQKQYQGYPEILEKVVPNYPPGAKRIVVDSGSWAEALKKSNVSLITEKIESFTEDGIKTDSGTVYNSEIIVYATGFKATDFLTPMNFVGRNGITLNEFWSGDARAYLGVVIPNFPNLFLLFGPNTNTVVNGSAIFFSECSVNYVLDCLRLLNTKKKSMIECEISKFNEFNQNLDAKNSKMIWGASAVGSWYKNKFGRVSQIWPFNVSEYWKLTKEANENDFHFF